MSEVHADQADVDADAAAMPVTPPRHGMAASPDSRSRQLRTAMARWENEGGACADAADDRGMDGDGRTALLLTNAELVQLQVRVIALEHLVTALLADAPPGIDVLVRLLAAWITPRPGRTPHTLTLHASAQMVHIAQRGALFRRKEALPTRIKRR
jgi:hypothetical protein